MTFIYGQTMKVEKQFFGAFEIKVFRMVEFFNDALRQWVFFKCGKIDVHPVIEHVLISGKGVEAGAKAVLQNANGFVKRRVLRQEVVQAVFDIYMPAFPRGAVNGVVVLIQIGEVKGVGPIAGSEKFNVHLNAIFFLTFAFQSSLRVRPEFEFRACRRLWFLFLLLTRRESQTGFCLWLRVRF